MASNLTWKAHLHEPTSELDVRAGMPPSKKIDIFSVQAPNQDAARRAIRTWLQERHYAVRSVNLLANEPRAFTAYVVPGTGPSSANKA